MRSWRPHAMVLDVMLPDMEGFEVARRLSAQHAPVPILFLSARDNTADRVRGLTMGGDDYVTKPFSLEELVARLRNILRRTGAFGEYRPVLTFAAVAIAPTREVLLHSAGPVFVAADPDQLRQVLANLTRNAVIHIPVGSAIELTVRRECDEAVLEVHDQGPGLLAGPEGRVFERFWRTEKGRVMRSADVTQ